MAGGTQRGGDPHAFPKKAVLWLHTSTRSSHVVSTGRSARGVPWQGGRPGSTLLGSISPMQAVLGRGIRLCPPRGLPKAPWGAGEGRGAAVGAPHSGAAILQPCPLPGLCWKVLGIGVPPAVVLAAPRLLGVLSAPGTAPINERPLLSPALHSHGADGCLILRHLSPGWGHGAGEVGGTTVGPWGCWWSPEVGGGGWGLGWKRGQSRNSPGAAGNGALLPPPGPALSPRGGGCQHR